MVHVGGVGPAHDEVQGDGLVGEGFAELLEEDIRLECQYEPELIKRLHCHWNVAHVVLTAELPDPVENETQQFQVCSVLEQVVDRHLWGQVLGLYHSEERRVVPLVLGTQGAQVLGGNLFLLADHLKVFFSF